MEEIKFQIRSISSLLMHNPQGMRSSNGNTLGRKCIPTPEEEAEVSAYKTEKGQLFIPSLAFRGALLNAGKGNRIGKVSATGKLAGAVFIDEAPVLLFDPETGKPLKDYEIDLRRVVVQRSGIIRARARVPRWKAEVTFNVDTNAVPEETLRQTMEIAGSNIGVLDFCPNHKGMFGRFEVLAMKSA
jgi:hypothetical protein